MNTIRARTNSYPIVTVSLLVVVLGLLSSQAHAVDGATAPYNEAVKIVNGKRIVEVEPLPKHWQSSIRNFRKPEVSGQTRHSVETEQGLMDCDSTPFYHPAACSPSNYGQVVYRRDWTVKMNGAWHSCSGRAKPVECIPLYTDAKPTDRKLRALAGMDE
jgi:hypothetical protein